MYASVDASRLFSGNQACTVIQSSESHHRPRATMSCHLRLPVALPNVSGHSQYIRSLTKWTRSRRPRALHMAM